LQNVPIFFKMFIFQRVFFNILHNVPTFFGSVDFFNTFSSSFCKNVATFIKMLDQQFFLSFFSTVNSGMQHAGRGGGRRPWWISTRTTMLSGALPWRRRRGEAGTGGAAEEARGRPVPAAAEPARGRRHGVSGGGGWGREKVRVRGGSNSRAGGMGCQEEEGGEERKLGLEVDPTVVIGCTNLKNVEVHLDTTFQKIYRILGKTDLHWVRKVFNCLRCYYAFFSTLLLLCLSI
jgi:hypothetical protein